jgi:hypothetical protein
MRPLMTTLLYTGAIVPAQAASELPVGRPDGFLPGGRPVVACVFSGKDSRIVRAFRDRQGVSIGNHWLGAPTRTCR